MKILEKNFTKLGFTFTQLKRNKNLAVYLKTKGKIKNYEVITILSHKDYFVNNVLIPAAETFPSSEQWGIYGFSYQTEAEAMKKFLALCAKRDNLLNETQKQSKAIHNTYKKVTII